MYNCSISSDQKVTTFLFSTLPVKTLHAHHHKVHLGISVTTSQFQPQHLKVDKEHSMFYSSVHILVNLFFQSRNIIYEQN